MSDIVEIKPHDKPEEYTFEDYPVPATDRNRVSAIFMNWVKDRLIKVPYILESGTKNGTYYEKWSDGKLIMSGYVDRNDDPVKVGYTVSLLTKDFNFPITPIYNSATYAEAHSVLYNGDAGFGDFQSIYNSVGKNDIQGSIHVLAFKGGWTNSNKRFGVDWKLEARWK